MGEMAEAPPHKIVRLNAKKKRGKKDLNDSTRLVKSFGTSRINMEELFPPSPQKIVGLML